MEYNKFAINLYATSHDDNKGIKKSPISSNAVYFIIMENI